MKTRELNENGPSIRCYRNQFPEIWDTTKVTEIKVNQTYITQLRSRQSDQSQHYTITNNMLQIMKRKLSNKGHKSHQNLCKTLSDITQMLKFQHSTNSQVFSVASNQFNNFAIGINQF